MYGNISDLGMGPHPPWMALAPRTPVNQRSVGLGWGFHIVRGGIKPRDHYFRPRFVGVAHGWKDLRSGEWTSCSLGAAEP